MKEFWFHIVTYPPSTWGPGRADSGTSSVFFLRESQRSHQSPAARFDVRPCLGRLQVTAFPRLTESPLRGLNPRAKAPVELGFLLKPEPLLQPVEPPGDLVLLRSPAFWPTMILSTADSAVAVMSLNAAGAILPPVATSISTIFSKITCCSWT